MRRASPLLLCLVGLATCASSPEVLPARDPAETACEARIRELGNWLAFSERGFADWGLHAPESLADTREALTAARARNAEGGWDDAQAGCDRAQALLEEADAVRERELAAKRSWEYWDNWLERAQLPAFSPQLPEGDLGRLAEETRSLAGAGRYAEAVARVRAVAADAARRREREERATTRRRKSVQDKLDAVRVELWAEARALMGEWFSLRPYPEALLRPGALPPALPDQARGTTFDRLLNASREARVSGERAHRDLESLYYEFSSLGWDSRPRTTPSSTRRRCGPPSTVMPRPCVPRSRSSARARRGRSPCCGGGGA